MEFEKGYLFGKQLGLDKYILIECEPNEYTEFGVAKYSYGNANYIKTDYEGLDNIEDGDTQWIDHENMLATDADSFIAETIGDAIIGYKQKTGDNPELYIRNTESNEFIYASNMTAEELTEKIDIQDDHLYQYDAECDIMNHVCR